MLIASGKNQYVNDKTVKWVDACPGNTNKESKKKKKKHL